ncbi:hypothetical protein [Oligosphaera ethanolica]|uniref:Uncharacterized protein n=1 Tax=Oligosphaera ethanolica TaxID=760260 RepID=A0AAE3VDY9_9BACT|nr:hypothetical protein [Oligosphaera ethanolica]MDQ0288540.1 hypothetical protein [Oligosphaera ethanolica]
MLVTLLGMTTPVRAKQLKNALFPMLVTLFGITTPVSPVQPENANSAIVVTGMPSISAGMVMSPPLPVYSTIATELLLMV